MALSETDRERITQVIGDIKTLAEKWNLEYVEKREVGGRTVVSVGVVFTPTDQTPQPERRE